MKRILNRINWPILIMANLFWYMETSHYGWNFTAQSDGEMVCDGIVLVLGAMSLLRLDRKAD